MNKIYVAADLHLGHKKLIEFEPLRSHFGTIEEHDETIIDNWNKIVNKKDTAYILGDVFFGHDGIEKIKRLNGYKHLVMGNHDQYPIELYQQVFNEIRGSMVVKNCILTHIPVHPQCVDRWDYNIHGHLYGKALPKSIIIGSNTAEISYYSKYICVSMEQTDLKPTLIDELIGEIS